VVLVILSVLAALALLTIIPALASRARLEEARAAMVAGREALKTGDAAGAYSAFTRAESAFRRARGYVENPFLKLISYLPVLGRTPDATGALAEAGADVARAGRVMAEGIEELPGGLGAFAPRDGQIPLDPIASLSEPLEEAERLIGRAGATVEEGPSEWLLGPVAGARAELVRELDDAERTLSAGVALTRTLPSFLGAEGPRRYFFGAQNPAELRGTGGFIGAFAILTAAEGRLEFDDFRPIQTLANLEPDQIPAPNADFATRYDRYGSRGFWPNINMTPDFPSAATAIERLYEEVEGEQLDGVIVADPSALASLLRVAGPTQVEETGVTLRAGTVVDYVTNQAYAQLTDPDARKRLLGDAAENVFERFLAGQPQLDAVATGRALADTAAGGHLLLHSTDPETQRAFVTAGVAGQLAARPGDFLAVVANNAAGNKADYYLDRTIRHEVLLGANGAASGRTTVTLTNDAPTGGQPAYVIGPFDPRFEPGQNLTILSTYCARSCRVSGFREDRAPTRPLAEKELGYPVFTTGVELPSGQARELLYDWNAGGLWVGDDGGGTYRLTVHGQTTIRPTELVVDIRTPEETTITSTSHQMQTEGNRAVWRGQLGDRTTFEVSFERPLFSRMWRAFVRFLDRPVIRLG
jgi:hypothetical protein